MDYNRYDEPRRYGEKEDSGLFEVCQCPTDSAALTNHVYIAPGVVDPKIHYVVVDRQFVFSVRYSI
jgi:vesicle-fusing ATPase